MNNILEVKGLCKQYASFRLKDVSFSMPKGFIMGFIGPNGAGKTTTIKAILSMIAPDQGSVEVFGQPFHSKSVELKEDIGIVMDFPIYVEEWTVAEVARNLGPFYQNWDAQRYDQLCRDFLLDQDRKVKDLSRGMKVKLMIAVALSHKAKLLIMDEPTSGLDPVARDDLMDILLEFISDENHGVLFSTHITADLEKVADYISYIKDGQIVFTGEKDDLLAQYTLVKGGATDLTPNLRERLVGLREYSVGFEGMLSVKDLGVLPPGAEAEPISLDQIVVFMNKEEASHA